MNTTFGEEFLVEMTTSVTGGAWGKEHFYELDYLLAFGYPGREMSTT